MHKFYQFTCWSHTRPPITSFIFLFIFIFFLSSSYGQKEIEQEDIDRSKRLTAEQFQYDKHKDHRDENGIVRCATVQMQERMFEDRMDDMRNRFEAFIKSSSGTCASATDVLTVPVVFHILHDGDPIGTGENIDAIFVEEQIKQANIDFRKIAGTSGDGAGVDTRIQFIPATVDPQGNIMTEPGINRVDVSGMVGFGPYSDGVVEDDLKAPTIWNPDLYFNTWTVELTGGLLGYAQFPEAPSLAGIGTGNGMESTDGIVVLFSSVGSINVPFPGAAPFNAGRTWTHEAGHFFGLRHIWGDGDCSADDFCSDTPNAGSSTSGCPIKDTCPADPGNDQVENYMDYSDDACMNIFTTCQTDRMRIVMGCGNAGSPRRASLSQSPIGTTDGIVLVTDEPELTVCFSSDAIANFSVTYVGGASGDATLSVSGLPANITPTFSNDVVNSSGPQTLTLTNLSTTAPGTYPFTINAADGVNPQQEIPMSLVIEGTVSATPTLTVPTIGATDAFVSTLFEWLATSNATGYDIQIATDPNFTTIVEMNSGLEEPSYTANSLSATTTYYWRVRGVSLCGVGPWSSGRPYTTGDKSPCFEFMGGPYFDFNEVDCFPECQTPLTVNFEVWANEVYVIDGITAGAEYTFEFCTGYDPSVWSANITVTDLNSNLIETTPGCSITFISTVSGSIAILITNADDCGGPEIAIDNGAPTFQCTGGGANLLDICPTCVVLEDFESGIPPGWSTNVTGASGPTWTNDDSGIGITLFGDITFTNPGEGNWLYYNDDAAGPNGENNVATATTPSYDIQGLENIILKFDFTFQDFAGSGDAILSITDGVQTYYFDGSDWVDAPSIWLTEDEEGTFNELIPLSLDLSNISVTLTYDDNNDWAWGIGIDNFGFCGSPKLIPTMGEWGLICLGIILMIFSLVSIKQTDQMTTQS